MSKKKKDEEEDMDDIDDEPEPPQFNTVETLLSFIPFTKESKIAAAAIEMLDNLKRIKKEKSKAYDLMVMAKIGQHEQALATMLSETSDNMDYFIQMRRRLAEEGNPIRTEVRKDTILSLERGKGKNRLKRATDVERDLSALTKKNKRSAQDTKKKVESTPLDRDVTRNVLPPADVQPKCGYYGFDQNGIALRCRNVCIIIKKKKKTKGESESEEQEGRMQFCPYHHPYCLAKKNHPNGRFPIHEPNAAGLCMSCFASRYPDTKKPMYALNTVPGVVLAPSLLHTVALPKEVLDRMNIDNLNRPLDISLNDNSKFDADVFKRKLLGNRLPQHAL